MRGVPHFAAIDPGAIRRVKVCVLNDAAAPVPEALIRSSLSAVFAEFKKEIRVEFYFERVIPYTGSVYAEGSDQARFLRRSCPGDALPRFVFSDRRVYSSDPFGSSAVLRPFGKDYEEILGNTSLYGGYVLMFNVQARAGKKDKGGNSALETSLRHEIGHLFTAEHTLDKRSFMYSPSQESLGQWTPEVRKILDEQQFFPWK